MATKRGRGRPRKDKEGIGNGRQVLPFEAVPDDEISVEQKKQIIEGFRSYLIERKHIIDFDGDLQKWLNAAADAIDAGDAARVGYYALKALYLRALLAYQEPTTINSPQPTGSLSLEESKNYALGKAKGSDALALCELADVGRASIAANKKRGRRGNW